MFQFQTRPLKRLKLMNLFLLKQSSKESLNFSTIVCRVILIDKWTKMVKTISTTKIIPWVVCKRHKQSISKFMSTKSWTESKLESNNCRRPPKPNLTFGWEIVQQDALTIIRSSSSSTKKKSGRWNKKFREFTWAKKARGDYKERIQVWASENQAKNPCYLKVN